MKYLTDREIHVVGVQRTGQHAITSWLIGHFNAAIYKNCMSQLGRKKGKMIGVESPFWLFIPSIQNERYVIEELHANSDAIILGTEFTVFDIGLNPKIPQQKQKICKKLGANEFSKRRDNLLVIRNPYNHYASVLKWGKNRLLSSPNSFSKTWVKMAKECLNHTNNFDEKIVVKYDDWFSSVDERILIEEKLDLPRSDSRLNVVMKIGHGNSWGSSFDGMKQKEKAQKMDVLKRWESVKDDPRFIELTKLEELKELSKELGWGIPYE